MRRPAGPLGEIFLQATTISANWAANLLIRHSNNFIRKQGMSRASPFHLISLLLFRCPEDAKIGDKMIYASSKDTIKKSFTGLSLEFQANDKGDLDYKTLSEEVEKKSLVSIHQNTTLKLYNFYFWFCSPAVYFSDGNKYQLVPPILHLLSLIVLMNLAVAGGHFVDRINFKKLIKTFKYRVTNVVIP